MDLGSVKALATDAVFLGKVTAALMRVAMEDGVKLYLQQDSTPADKALIRFYREVLEQPEIYGAKFAWALASDDRATTTPTDDTILAGVRKVAQMHAKVPI